MSARQIEVLGSPVGRTASMPTSTGVPVSPSGLQGVSPFFPEGAGLERRLSGSLQPGDAQAQPPMVMCHFGDPAQPFQLHRLEDVTPASAARPGGPPMPSPLQRGSSVPQGAAPVVHQLQAPQGAVPAPGPLYRAQTAPATPAAVYTTPVASYALAGSPVGASPYAYSPVYSPSPVNYVPGTPTPVRVEHWQQVGQRMASLFQDPSLLMSPSNSPSPGSLAASPMAASPVYNFLPTPASQPHYALPSPSSRHSSASPVVHPQQGGAFAVQLIQSYGGFMGGSPPSLRPAGPPPPA